MWQQEILKSLDAFYQNKSSSSSSSIIILEGFCFGTDDGKSVLRLLQTNRDRIKGTLKIVSPLPEVLLRYKKSFSSFSLPTYVNHLLNVMLKVEDTEKKDDAEIILVDIGIIPSVEQRMLLHLLFHEQVPANHPKKIHIIFSPESGSGTFSSSSLCPRIIHPSLLFHSTPPRTSMNLIFSETFQMMDTLVKKIQGIHDLNIMECFFQQDMEKKIKKNDLGYKTNNRWKKKKKRTMIFLLESPFFFKNFVVALEQHPLLQEHRDQVQFKYYHGSVSPQILDEWVRDVDINDPRNDGVDEYTIILSTWTPLLVFRRLLQRMDIVVDWGLTTTSLRHHNNNGCQWIAGFKIRERIAACFPVEELGTSDTSYTSNTSKTSNKKNRYMFVGMNETRVLSGRGKEEEEEGTDESHELCWLRLVFSQLMMFPSPHNTTRIHTIHNLLKDDSRDKTMFEKSLSCLYHNIPELRPFLYPVINPMIPQVIPQVIHPSITPTKNYTNLRHFYNALMKRNLNIESFPALEFLQHRDPGAFHVDTKMALLAIAVVDTFKEYGQGRVKFFDIYPFGDRPKTQDHPHDCHYPNQWSIPWSIPEWVRSIQNEWNVSRKVVIEDDLQMYMSIFILCFLVDTKMKSESSSSMTRLFSCRVCGSCCPFTRYKVNRKIYKMIYTRWCSNLKLFWVRESSTNINKRAFEFLDLHFQITASSLIPSLHTKHTCPPCPVLQHRLLSPIWDDMRSLLIRVPKFGGVSIMNYSCCGSYIRWYSLYPHPQTYRPVFQPIVVLQDRCHGKQRDIQCWMSYPKKEMENIRSLFQDLQGNGFHNLMEKKRVREWVSQYKKDFLHRDIMEIVAFRPGNEGYLRLLEKNTKLFAQWTKS